MSVRLFVSTCSGSMEIKKKQDFIKRLLDSNNIEYEEVDITSTQNEEQKAFMQKNAKACGDQAHPIPPQLFLGDEYCGNFDDFHEAVECDTLFDFLKIANTAENTVKSTEEVEEPVGEQ